MGFLRSAARTSRAVSPNGGRVAFDAGASLALIDVAGGGFRLLRAHGVDDGEPAFSPTGRRIAFSAGPVPSVHRPLARGVWTSDLSGAHARRVTALGVAPAWSAHDWIAFLRVDGGYRVRPGSHGREVVPGGYSVTAASGAGGGRLAAAAPRRRQRRRRTTPEVGDTAALVLTPRTTGESLEACQRGPTTARPIM